ncbi:MAG: type II/IV secretion system protein [Candidatus Pacebacteria bacterium]|nr:type II/IV secretion system protein [Candidatus Paceibacterota bacterium]
MLKFDDSYSNTRITDLHAQEEERSIQANAPQLGFEYINLRGFTINPSALSVIPEAKARSLGLVAFSLNRQELSVAAKNPTAPQVQAYLQELQKARYEISVFMCSAASLEHAWNRYADLTVSTAEKRGVFEINTDDVARLMSSIKQKEDVLGLLKNISTINNTRRISETLELIFAGAVALGASDIHIEPEESGVRLRYRFDGVLHDIVDIDNYIYGRLMSRFKLLSGMVLNTKAEAQDGRFTFSIGTREVEVRASAIPGAYGESIVMRLLDPSLATFTMDRIKLNPHIEEVIRRELKKPNGLIITTGPTGSGKTTALYAFLQEVHNEEVKIITIENPVEYKLEGIVQTQTGDNYTFASGLRALLRQDPDIIMIGEIRDREVAETAIHAAQTGHLVFSTLHTNSAVAGFVRLIDLGIDPRVMGTSINAILGQRLVRVLCSACKVSYEATPEEKTLVEFVMNDHPHPVPVPQPLMLYKPTGCAACGGTGFKGRAGIHEAVVMDEAVEEVVLRDPREHMIAEAAKPQGIPNMVQDGIEKVLRGETSLAELERVIELPYLAANKQKNTLQTPPPAQTEPGETDFLSHVV